jgi:hypothetical protein
MGLTEEGSERLCKEIVAKKLNTSVLLKIAEEIKGTAHLPLKRGRVELAGGVERS